MNVKFAKRAAIAGGVAALSVGLVAPMAQADPPVTTPPTYRKLVGVGSDTTQDVMNGLGNVIVDPTNTPSHFLIASYDAINPATGLPGGTIQTRPSTCTAVARPNGSTAGVKALRDDITAGTGCIDFARSSAAPNTTGQFTFIPYAIDGVTAAVKSGSTLPSNITSDALRRAYNCLDQTGTVGNPLPAGTFPTINGVTVHPLVPQAGSGTRKFWASKLGFSATTLPGCVSDIAKDGKPVQEHHGVALQRTVAADGSEDVMPFSIAQWLAFANGVVPDARSGALLESVDGLAPTTGSPAVLNTSFKWTREVYNVIKTTRLTETYIKLAFVGATSKVCTNTVTINKYGFGTDPNCGVTTTTGDLV